MLLRWCQSLLRTVIPHQVSGSSCLGSALYHSQALSIVMTSKHQVSTTRMRASRFGFHTTSLALLRLWQVTSVKKTTYVP